MKVNKIVFSSMIFLLLTSCNQKNINARTIEMENKEIITIYFEDIWNRGNLELLNEVISDSYVNNNPGTPNPKPGPEGLRPIIEAMRTAFPDLKFVIHDIVCADDKVAIYSTMTGTHKGDLFGIAPTGKKVEIDQMQIEKLENGKIVEHWRVTDDMKMMRQLGLLE